MRELTSRVSHDIEKKGLCLLALSDKEGDLFHRLIGVLSRDFLREKGFNEKEITTIQQWYDECY